MGEIMVMGDIPLAFRKPMVKDEKTRSRPSCF